jgi:hypothetical protein
MENNNDNNIELTAEYIRAQFDKAISEFLKERNQTTLDRIVDDIFPAHPSEKLDDNK